MDILSSATFAKPIIYNNIKTFDFHIACLINNYKTVKILMEDEEVDINVTGKNGRTPFHSVCSLGYTEIVKLFLNNNKTDFNKTDEFGITPFYFVCTFGRVDIMKLLINDKRIDTEKEDNRGHIPLYAASYRGYKETIKLLLDDRLERIRAYNVDRANNKEKIDNMKKQNDIALMIIKKYGYYHVV